MLMRFFALIFSLLLLSAYAKTPTNTSSTVAKRITQQRQVSDFNEIVVEGNLDISLHTGYSRPQVILKGDSRDLASLIIAVKNNVLLVYRDGGKPRFGNVHVEIRGRSLNTFNYHGVGTITGPKLYSGNLDLTIENPGKTLLNGTLFLRKLHVSGDGYVEINGISSPYLQLAVNDGAKVKLVGVMNLAKLKVDGDGALTMYWIKSKALKICGQGHSFMQLAGVVEKLDVELWDRSHFNGKYLRAQNVFVKTHEKSIADITALKHQHSLSTDASDIYFYNIPTTRADFMAYQGSVLDMRDWSPPEIQEYDRYNK